MVYGGVVFAEVISFVLFAWAPVDKEVSLLDAVSDPVEAHINGFGSPLFYCVRGEADSYFIVCLYRSWWL